jgi:hypothetical protein
MTTFYCLIFETPSTCRARSPYLHPPEQGGPVIPQGTGFPFRRLLRLAGLRWRYSNPPPRGLLNMYTSIYHGQSLFQKIELFMITAVRTSNCTNRKQNNTASHPGSWYRFHSDKLASVAGMTGNRLAKLSFPPTAMFATPALRTYASTHAQAPAIYLTAGSFKLGGGQAYDRSSD